MKLFISWSKEPSKQTAEALRIFIEDLFHDKVETWLSFESIPYGSMFSVEIANALHNSDKGIACLTLNNYSSPWIMYEMGAIKHGRQDKNDGDENIIFPILFDCISKNKFQNNPLSQFQMVDFNQLSMKKLVKQINGKVLSFKNDEALNRQFDLNWSVLENSINKIFERKSIIEDGVLSCQHLIDAFSENKFPNPDKGDIIKYYGGFETQKLYDILLGNADKRLWFYGRKNRKLFSNDNRFFFKDLSRKIQNGFDFRCLFVDPTAITIVEKAQRINNFQESLTICIKNAIEMLTKNGVRPKDVCRSCCRIM